MGRSRQGGYIIEIYVLSKTQMRTEGDVLAVVVLQQKFVTMLLCKHFFLARCEVRSYDTPVTLIWNGHLSQLDD